MSMTAILAQSGAAAQPSREEGQQWAEEELSDPIYHEADTTLLSRIGRAITDFLDDLFRGVAGIEHPLLIVVVILAVGLLVAAIVWFTRRAAGVPLERSRTAAPVFGTELDPVVLRRTSQEAAEAGDWRRAVQDLVRAVFAEQAKAGRIGIDRASTAHELAAAAGGALPGSAAAFTGLGELFDTVSFSGRPSLLEEYERTVALDRAVARAASGASETGAQEPGAQGLQTPAAAPPGGRP